MRPVEGTILTVVREAAEAVESRRDRRRRSSRVLERAADAAAAPSVRTHARAAAGARARPAWSTRAARASRCCSTRSSRSPTAARSPSPRSSTTPASVEAHLRGDDVSGLRYEVMYLLDAADATIGGFKDAWGAIGDSIVVVGGDGMWNCHVHTNDIGAAVEAGIDAGRPRKIRVTDLIEQVERGAVGARGRVVVDVDADGDRPSRPRSSRSAVGDGVRRLLHEPRRAAGRRGRAVDEPVDRADPRSGRGVQRRRGGRAAEQQEHRAGRAAGRRAHRASTSRSSRRRACPRRSPRSSTTTPTRELDANDDRDGGSASSACAPARSRRPCATRSAECGPIARRRLDRAHARRASSPRSRRRPTRCARCSATSSTTTARSSPCSSAADAPAAETQRIREHIELQFPHVEVEFHDGGQPLYPYLVGVE